MSSDVPIYDGVIILYHCIFPKKKKKKTSCCIKLNWSGLNTFSWATGPARIWLLSIESTYWAKSMHIAIINVLSRFGPYLVLCNACLEFFLKVCFPFPFLCASFFPLRYFLDMISYVRWTFFWQAPIFWCYFLRSL